MIKRIALPSFLALGLATGGARVDADPGIRTESGRLQDLIATLAGRDYVLDEPASDSRPYIDPTPVLHAFRHLASALAWGNAADAARRAEELDYEVVKFKDIHSKNEYYVLREDLTQVEECRGWGSYIVNPKSRVDAIVEVPHPFADAQTPEIGGAVFEQSAAKGFLLAGAHRLKADVPDLIDSVFHQVHMAWVGPAARVTAWQIHGFASYKHSFPKGAQIVASAGDGVVVPELASLDSMFEEQGLSSFVFNDRPAESRVNKRLNGGVPGAAFMSLAATANEQGRLSRSLGGAFVHIELESNVRNNTANREAAATIIAAALSGAPARPVEAPDDQMVEVASADSDSPDRDVAVELAVSDEAPPSQPPEVAAQSAARATRGDGLVGDASAFVQ